MADKFEFLTEIGRGGMGVVYRARSTNLDRIVAVKKFHAQLDAETLQRARREAHCLSKIEHPNLVRVHSIDAGESQELILVVGFIDGDPLSTLIREGRINPNKADLLFRQLCDGLTAMHKEGIVHRDIKPANLMVERTDTGTLRLKIIDFGLAKSFVDSPSQKLTRTGHVVGTPAYMSPEQFAGVPLTPAADVYSAGCVLFELLTGRLPFPHESPYMVAHAQLTEEPPDLVELVPTLKNAKALDAVIKRALTAKVEERFRTTADLKEAYEDAFDHGKFRTPQRKPSADAYRLRYIRAAVITCILISAIIFVSYNAKIKLEDSSEKITTAQEMTDKAQALIRDRKYEEAKALLNRNIARFVNNSYYEITEAYNQLAHTYLKTDDPAEAQKAVETALYLEQARPLPNHTHMQRCYFTLGLSLAAQAKYEEAWDAFEQFGKCREKGLENLSDEYFNIIARTRLHLNQWKEVMPEILHRVETHATPGHRHRYTASDPIFDLDEQRMNELLSLALRKKGDLYGAIEVTKNTIAKSAPNADDHLELALEQALVGDYEDSEETLRDKQFQRNFVWKQKLVDAIHTLNRDKGNLAARQYLLQYID